MSRKFRFKFVVEECLREDHRRTNKDVGDVDKGVVGNCVVQDIVQTNR